MCFSTLEGSCPIGRLYVQCQKDPYGQSPLTDFDTLVTTSLVWQTVCYFVSKFADWLLQWSYLIFVIFSPPIQFWAQFFSMQKGINHDTTDFAKNSVNRHKTDFTAKNRVNFIFIHICHVEKFEILKILAKFQISPHLFCRKSKIPLHVETFQISPHLSCI